MLTKLVVGSRKSKLALIQTNLVINELRNQPNAPSFEVKEISTKGDKNLHVSLAKLGNQGVFLEELEDQLLKGEVDIAVHSLKDIPAKIPEELTIASIPKRADHRDAYISKDHTLLKDLPKGAIIGTSSVRRRAQILAHRPDVQTKWIRGPIDSRIKQMDEGNYDAIILAVAGMKRLGIDESRITEYLPDHQFVPAMGQGALAIECRKDDTKTRQLLASIHDMETGKAVTTERLFLQAFDEGEQAPIGGYAFVSNGIIHLRGMVISLDGTKVLTHEATGKNPAEVAEKVADYLIQEGAMDLIEEANAELEVE